MSDSDTDGESTSKPRVGLVFFRAAGGFVADESAPPPRIRRRRWLPAPAVTVSILSGASPESHHVYTWMIPDGATSIDSIASTPAAAEGLRVRRSTEVGRSLIWNRVAEHGIDSIVVGSPFMPGGRSGVEERTVHAGYGVLGPSSGSKTEDKFSMLAESKARYPDARFVFLGLGSEDISSGAGVETTESPDATPRRVVEESVDRLKREMDLDHIVVVSMGGTFEWVSYRGPREVSKTRRVRAGVVVQTIFDLLELPRPADVASSSMLELDDGEDESPREPHARWVVPVEEDAEPLDFEPMLDRIRGGEAGPITRRVGRQLLESRWESAFDRGSVPEADEISRDLLLTEDTPVMHLRRLISLAAKGDVESFAAARSRLHELHPGTMVDRLVDLLPTSALTDEARRSILDGNPVKDVHGLVLRGLWCRCAIRLGRTDEGLEVLWGRINNDAASRRDTMIFAAAAIERNQGDDLKRARIALWRQLETMQGPERRSKMLRKIAHTFELEGDLPMAVRCLEGFLARNPHEVGATRMLDRLKRMMND